MSQAEILAELEEIVRTDYGITLSKGELFDMARTLTSFYEVLIYGKEVSTNVQSDNHAKD